jgi:Sulfotransferase domain
MPEMWNRLRYTARVLLRKNPAGRGLTVFPDDVFLVSYPRSGNTWTRFLIGNLIYTDEPITFANVESRIPEIYLFNDPALRKLPRPRVLKSHEYFDPRYRTTIYIVRDPRDVAVSTYHYSIKRRNIAEDCSIAEFVPRFLAGEFFVNWGTWAEHVGSWYATRRGKKDFLLLQYENMLQDPVRELKKVSALLQIPADSERLNRAVELSSARRMQELEQAQGKEWKLTQNTRLDKPFVRKAKQGTWREELPADSVRTIESAWGDLMVELGYQLAYPEVLNRDEMGVPLASSEG